MKGSNFRFRPAVMTDAERDFAHKLRARFEGLEGEIQQIEDGPATRAAMERLEEAAMWANKALSHYGLERPKED